MDDSGTSIPTEKCEKSKNKTWKIFRINKWIKSVTTMSKVSSMLWLDKNIRLTLSSPFQPSIAEFPSVVDVSVKDGPMEILDLNTYCLLEICEYLGVSDLGALADTCQSMRMVARMSFSTRYTPELQLADRDSQRHRISIREDIKFLRCLRNFGVK